MGRHTLKVGWSTTRAQVNDLQSNNGRGTFNFNPDFGRTAVENLLVVLRTCLRLPSGISIAVSGTGNMPLL